MSTRLSTTLAPRSFRARCCDDTRRIANLREEAASSSHGVHACAVAVPGAEVPVSEIRECGVQSGSGPDTAPDGDASENVVPESEVSLSVQHAYLRA